MAKEDIQILSKYMKRYSASLVIRKMQIQIRMSYSYPRMRMAKMRKMEKENRYCVWGATGTLVHCGRRADWDTLLENCLAESVTALGASNPLLGYVCKCLPKDMYPNVLWLYL